MDSRHGMPLQAAATLPGRRLAAEELRGLFLFADLDDDQLAWVAESGEVVDVPAGTVLAREGDPAEWFYVLLAGTLSMTQRSGTGEVEIIRSATRGVFCGAVQFYFGDHATRPYAATSRAVTDGSFLVLSAAEFAVVFRRWYPMAVHLLQGLFAGMRTTNELVGQRERLSALGALTSGLMHGLNNPAAAAGRAAAALRERAAAVWTAWSDLVAGTVDPTAQRALLEVRSAVVARIADRPELGALAQSDQEDVLADWLIARDVRPAWELAGALAPGGVEVADLDSVASLVGAADLEPALRWLAAAADAQTLVAEIADATHRVSELVDAAKQYSQLDRTPFQPADLAAGVDATLLMLSAKLTSGITVVRDYDDALPRVPGHAAELNQVWTHLIDNALDAMAGEGTLTLRTAVDGESALVEVADTGPGIPPDLRHRVFEPFFTTKPVGQGTGLGLDVCRRIVVDRHAGDLRVLSQPGATRFQVRLPLHGPPGPGQSDDR
jgi:signal transduction histidine kinase